MRWRCNSSVYMCMRPGAQACARRVLVLLPMHKLAFPAPAPPALGSAAEHAARASACAVCYEPLHGGRALRCAQCACGPLLFLPAADMPNQRRNPSPASAYALAMQQQCLHVHATWGSSLRPPRPCALPPCSGHAKSAKKKFQKKRHVWRQPGVTPRRVQVGCREKTPSTE
jgi:hypothetical protein